MTEGAQQQVTRVSAYAVCVDDERRILLCRLAPGFSDEFVGWWTLPGGGLGHGEDPRDGALRELTEETGLVGEIEGLFEVDSWHTVLAGPDGLAEDYHGIRVLYRCRIVGGELRDEASGSTNAARWFAPDDLPAVRLVDIAELAVRRIGVA